ncbi:YggS family pyridoxal phosphate-dependent enzyme [Listeria grayi]|uniref:YggS family pyridoxal phosphate-dependent enzyme n=1 Tax=Listeria grayi TaxID=1641 RepID=UPI001625C47D|nr:YggS family pyridoxal phosphate-dependent enzyme [Listeria grayi]MBC1922261.1 YggS family pyridoxal phosphate-dependent enzyme [Listeria grayi]
MNEQTKLTEVKQRIEAACKRADRSADSVELIAVTKHVDAAKILDLHQLGLSQFGENRADVLVKKAAELKDHSIDWHYIGSLQTRKVRQILPLISCLHSLDRESLAVEIEKRAETEIPCFLQVNITGEASKHGFSPEEALAFVNRFDFQKIKVIGLMTMAPLTEDAAIIRQAFTDLAALGQAIQKLAVRQAPCLKLSMGMTNDFEIAIEEGATHIRIGRALVE